MVEIPLQKLPAQRLNIVLDDQNCTIHLFWRWGRCYMDLSVDDTEIFTGAICQNLQAVNQSPSIYFAGSLYFCDTLGDVAPQWEGLGDRWRLVYLSAEETATSAFAQLEAEGF